MQANQTCAICERQPEDLLVLACAHNLCVGCATQIFLLNGGANPFTCEICLMETQLDQQTISHFHSSTQRENSPEKPQKPKKGPRPPKSRSPSKKPHQSLQVPRSCETHKQAALYYCFNCNTADICSECILTPKHSNHRVLTLKKAYQALGKKLDEEIKACQNIRVRVDENREIIGIRRKECADQFRKRKQEIKQTFDQIARQVSQKYAQICQQIDQQCTRALQIYDAYLNEINQKHKLLQNAIKIQKRALAQPSDSGLMEYMANWTDHRDVFAVELPHSLPVCSVQLFNASSVCQELFAVLGRLELGRGQEEEQIGAPIDYSVIGQQELVQQASKTALKQSYHQGIGNSSNILHRSNTRVNSSRKLDLSRSIENATYIINKLQQRSKNP